MWDGRADGKTGALARLRGALPFLHVLDVFTRSRPSKSERGDRFIVRPIVRFMDFVPQLLTKLTDLTDPTVPTPIRAPHRVGGRSRCGDHHG